jgi:hypothetical protein
MYHFKKINFYFKKIKHGKTMNGKGRTLGKVEDALEEWWRSFTT